MIEIPLESGSKNAHQTFSVQLGDNYLDFEINYVGYIDTPCWTVNISMDKTPLVMGAMLVSGADITANYNANIGRFAFVGDETTLDNLGKSNNLVWVTE
jgi:hypothetical protein